MTKTEDKINQLEQTINNATRELNQLREEYKNEVKINNSGGFINTLSARNKKIFKAIEELYEEGYYPYSSGVSPLDVQNDYEELVREHNGFSGSGYLTFSTGDRVVSYYTKEEFLVYLKDIFYDGLTGATPIDEALLPVVVKITKRDVSQCDLFDIIKISYVK